MRERDHTYRWMWSAGVVLGLTGQYHAIIVCCATERPIYHSNPSRYPPISAAREGTNKSQADSQGDRFETA